MKAVYLDNNASSPLDPEVLEAMRPYLEGFVGNASSRHSAGRRARRAIDDARRRIASALNAESAEIVFTSGATEANNLVVQGAPGDGPILCSAIEHPSVLEPVRAMEKRGAVVRVLPVDGEGFVGSLAGAVDSSTRLSAIQTANSETGVLQDVPRLAVEAGECWFHCDAVQAVGRVPVDFAALGVTSLAISGHKINGPGGVGALVIKKGFKLRPMLHGGHQQGGFRPGTEPVAAIVGLGFAVERSVASQKETAAAMRSMRDRLERALLAAIPGATRNGPHGDDQRLPNTTNISFPDATAQALVMALDLAWVCCSAGSACASGSMLPSHVLQAMGLEGERLTGGVRFSVGRATTAEEVDEAAKRIVRTVEQVSRIVGSAPDRAFA